MNIIDLKQQVIKQFDTPLLAGICIILLSIGLVALIWKNIYSIWFEQPALATQPFHLPHFINNDQLVNEHLLGANATNLSDLPLASLGVTLVGIFADNQGKSTALITLSGKQTAAYHEGDKLAPNVVIEKILPYSIIVQHNGNLEKLALPIQPLQFTSQLPASDLWGS